MERRKYPSDLFKGAITAVRHSYIYFSLATRFGYVWVWYTVLFCIGLCLLSMVGSTWSLLRVRFATGGSLGGSEDTVEDNVPAVLAGSLEAKGATLTFENVNYIVKASTTNDKLHLLKGISGYFSAGKMTALMGSRSVKYSSLKILPLAVLCFSTSPNKT